MFQFDYYLSNRLKPPARLLLESQKEMLKTNLENKHITKNTRKKQMGHHVSKFKTHGRTTPTTGTMFSTFFSVVFLFFAGRGTECVFCCFHWKNRQKGYPPKKKKTYKSKQNQTTSPFSFVVFVVLLSCFCFSNPTALLLVLIGFYPHYWKWPENYPKKKMPSPKIFVLGFCGVFGWKFSRNWMAWKLVMEMIVKRGQQKSLPHLAEILGQPQEDLAVSFNELCQYCSSQPRFPTLFAVAWREAASENLCGSVQKVLKWKPMMLCCSWQGSNVDRKVMKIIWTVHYSGGIKFISHFGGSNNANVW